jgi:hypothetical protein
MAYGFDLDEWLPRFPLTPSCGRYSGEGIDGPGSICNNEQLRREMKDEYDWGQPVPVDIFVMAEGEPNDRSVTKVGGLPFRGRNDEWPTTKNGEPMLFLAQFNFSDSKDIVGELPSEVLLVFGNSLSDCLDEIEMEWQSTRLADEELIGTDEIPLHGDQFVPCFGYRFRTKSYPHAARLTPFSEQKYPRCRGLDVWSDFFLLQYMATQIGQAPFFIQPDDCNLPGTMLCTISSVGEACETPFPFINRPDPVPLSSPNFRHLMLGDAGCVYISIDDAQQLHWGWSCF